MIQIIKEDYTFYSHCADGLLMPFDFLVKSSNRSSFDYYHVPLQICKHQSVVTLFHPNATEYQLAIRITISVLNSFALGLLDLV